MYTLKLSPLDTKKLLKKQIASIAGSLSKEYTSVAKEALKSRAQNAIRIVRELLGGPCRKDGGAARYPDMPGRCSGSLLHSFKYRTAVKSTKNKVSIEYLRGFLDTNPEVNRYADSLNRKGSRNNPQIAGYKDRVAQRFDEEIQKVLGDLANGTN